MCPIEIEQTNSSAINYRNMKLQPQQQQQQELVTWWERKSMTTINVSAACGVGDWHEGVSVAAHKFRIRTNWLTDVCVCTNTTHWHLCVEWLFTNVSLSLVRKSYDYLHLLETASNQQQQQHNKKIELKSSTETKRTKMCQWKVLTTSNWAVTVACVGRMRSQRIVNPNHMKIKL